MNESLNRDALLARMWYFDPDTFIPLMMLTSTAASVLPNMSPQDDVDRVVAILHSLADDDLVVEEDAEWAFRLTPDGQMIAAALPEELRHSVADPVERAISEWFTLLHDDEIADSSATMERLLAHTASVARHATARGGARIAVGMHMLRGQELLAQGNAGAAAQDAVAALTAAQRLEDDSDLGLMMAHDLSARVAFYQGDLNTAEAHAREALRHMPPDQDVEEVVFHTLRLAAALAEQERHAEVLELLEPVMPQVRQGSPDMEYLSSLLRCYGTSLVATGAHDEGLAILHDAVGRLEADGDLAELVSALDDLAMAQATVGQIDAAVASFERAIQIAQEQERFDPGIALSLSNFAGILRVRGDLARARTLLQRAQVIARLTRADPDLQAMIAHNITDLEATAAGERIGPVQLRAQRAVTPLRPLRTVVTVLVAGDWGIIDDALMRLPENDPAERIDLIDSSMELAALAGTTVAIQAIHAHILRYQEVYEALGISLIPLPRQGTGRWFASDFCIFSEQTLRDEEEDPSFTEEVERAAMHGVLARLQDELADDCQLPGHILAPTDMFFSAPDGEPNISPATWAAFERNPAPYMLVDIDLLVLPIAIPNRAELLAADEGWDEDDLLEGQDAE